MTCEGLPLICVYTGHHAPIDVGNRPIMVSDNRTAGRQRHISRLQISNREVMNSPLRIEFSEFHPRALGNCQLMVNGMCGFDWGGEGLLINPHSAPSSAVTFVQTRPPCDSGLPAPWDSSNVGTILILANLIAIRTMFTTTKGDQAMTEAESKNKHVAEVQIGSVHAGMHMVPAPSGFAIIYRPVGASDVREPPGATLLVPSNGHA